MAQRAQVVFSAEGRDHSSDGNPDLIIYQTTHENVGGGWNNSSTFNAPFPGVYFFAISCVRNAVNTGGTEDDIRIALLKNGAEVGFAWCGAESGKRNAGAYNVAIRLARNDRIETFAQSDGGRQRVFGAYQFSGFLVR
jgi:uncharacterized protein (DUF736 family)